VRYRIAPAFDSAARGLETSYRRLLLALLGLSGFSLLCLGYMILHAQALSERVARESAQEATLDLADRTCHELGNGIFVLTNERRNLAEHLDLIERFVAEEREARAAAAQRAGIDPDSARRWDHALRREYAARGIDPDLELRGSAAIARHVCRQIDVCSEYIRMTVRELDGFLKRSALPVTLERVDVGECFDEAVALLGPRLDAADVRIVRRVDGARRLFARADRRLLIHALVNLLKNAVEAVSGSAWGQVPEITLSARAEGKMVWLSVADNGPGITPELRERIFDDRYTTKGPGRGRGLAIVRESVSVQDGEILVGDHAGGGTEFRIGLPVDAEPPAQTTDVNGLHGDEPDEAD
jgi:signal transduction histidine kinase